MIKIEIKGIDKLNRKFRILPRRLKGGIENAIRKSAFLVEATSKETVSRGPLRAVDTGRMMRSIAPDYVRAFETAIAPHTEYAIYVHEGTRYMRARPFMKVGAEKAEPGIRRFFEEAVKEAIR